jgi:hypothetical protein
MQPSPAIQCIERDRLGRLITGFDFSDELAEASEEILAAVRTGSDVLTGQVVRAIFDAYAVRLADTYLEITPQEPVYAQQAARDVLVKHRSQQRDRMQDQRRFSQADRALAHRLATGVAEFGPPSNYGSLQEYGA